MTDARTVYEGKYLRMVVRGHWEYVERTHADGMAVIIIAVTPDDDVLFVEQYRVPLQRRTIEMPAGLVGDDVAGDTLEDAAKRELIEETGWEAGRVRVLMTGPTSSGMSSERIAFVRATQLTRVGAGGGVAGFEVDLKLWAGLWMIDRNPDGSPA
jgi:ADP-ribose pyrophosphatase